MEPIRTPIEKDLASSCARTAITWGPGVLVMLLSIPLGGWSQTVGWTVGLLWLAGFCLLNFARCGRVHCLFTGPFFLAMAVVSILAGLGVFSLGKNTWGVLGDVILFGGLALWFGPEMLWGRYWQPALEQPSGQN